MLHQTYVRVRLDHIRQNLENLRKAVGPGRKILVPVKANGYGHGAVEIARLGERTGLVDWLGVSNVPEGLELREAGLALPVLKLSPAFPEEMEAAVGNRVTLTVCEQSNIQALEDTCRRLGTTAPVHLKVDTGMGRIGVTPEEAPAMAAMIERECPHLQLQWLFTHLPVSDDVQGVVSTQDQIHRFRGVSEAVNQAVGRPVPVHCCNSGAVLGHSEGWMDMVRPGVMVYGYYPDDTTPRSISLLPSLRFRTSVFFLKRVPKGARIGYGSTWEAPEDTWIATIPVGYADGFNRLFSNTGRVLVNGRSYPVVGRVCMDQSMICLGSATEVRVGDEVVLIGRSGEQEISVYEWAKALRTIPYEVTCQINARVERTYEGG